MATARAVAEMVGPGWAGTEEQIAAEVGSYTERVDAERRSQQQADDGPRTPRVWPHPTPAGSRWAAPCTDACGPASDRVV